MNKKYALNDLVCATFPTKTLRKIKKGNLDGERLQWRNLGIVVIIPDDEDEQTRLFISKHGHLPGQQDDGSLLSRKLRGEILTFTLFSLSDEGAVKFADEIDRLDELRKNGEKSAEECQKELHFFYYTQMPPLYYSGLPVPGEPN